MEDATGTLKLHKCKGPVRPGGRALSNLVPKYYGQGGEACTCEGGDYQLGLPGRRKKFFKKSECGGWAVWDRRGGITPGWPHSFEQFHRHARQGAGDTAKPLMIHPVQWGRAEGETEDGLMVC